MLEASVNAPPQRPLVRAFAGRVPEFFSPAQITLSERNHLTHVAA